MSLYQATIRSFLAIPTPTTLPLASSFYVENFDCIFSFPGNAIDVLGGRVPIACASRQCCNIDRCSANRCAAGGSKQAEEMKHIEN